jgi:hypothetical protein
MAGIIYDEEKQHHKILEGDYVLEDGHGVWIETGGYAIRIRDDGETIKISAFENKKEMVNEVIPSTILRKLEGI